MRIAPLTIACPTVPGAQRSRTLSDLASARVAHFTCKGPLRRSARMPLTCIHLQSSCIGSAALDRLSSTRRKNVQQRRRHNQPERDAKTPLWPEWNHVRDEARHDPEERGPIEPLDERTLASIARWPQTSRLSTQCRRPSIEYRSRPPDNTTKIQTSKMLPRTTPPLHHEMMAARRAASWSCGRCSVATLPLSGLHPTHSIRPRYACFLLQSQLHNTHGSSEVAKPAFAQSKE
jgi:hypothetical protein